MALISPGKYDFSYNQEYLLTKFWAMDIYWSLFVGFWFSLIVVVVFYYARKYYYKIESEKSDIKKHEDLKEVFQEFHEICRLIHEDTNVFKRPQSMIELMYYERMRELLVIMGANRGYMIKNYKWVLPDYEFYKKELASKDNKS